MTRKLTITIDDRVYDGLHAVIGRGNIGKFLEDLARPFVVTESMSAASAEMFADKNRDAEADDWCESLVADGPDATCIALLAAAAFWTWLWGRIGLVLSTPLTACLVVLGQYVPHMEFLGVLLGDEPA